MRLLTALAFLSVLGSTAAGQASFEARDLAEYRLTDEVFRQFEQASRLIGAVTATDPRFKYAPLFTREVAVSGDATQVATDLVARLENNPPLVEALGTARISAHDYAQFALALFAARLAQGFVEAGVLRRVPPGAAADNVAFVSAHRAEITAVLKEIGVED